MLYDYFKALPVWCASLTQHTLQQPHNRRAC